MVTVLILNLSILAVFSQELIQLTPCEHLVRGSISTTNKDRRQTPFREGAVKSHTSNWREAQSQIGSLRWSQQLSFFGGAKIQARNCNGLG